VLALALGSGLVWTWVEPSRAVWVVVSVLIVTCPCALSLAAPSALVAAAGAWARGVMVQRLDALEALAAMSRLYTDKTGTLTEERPQWARTVLLQDGQTDARELMRLAASLATWSTHPRSRCWRRTSGTRAVWRRVRAAGAGLEGTDEHGARGGWGLVLGSGAGLAATSVAAAGDAPCVYFGRPGAPGALRVRRAAPPGVPEALAALQADGVQVGLLSGDVGARVQKIAQLLGLRDVHGDATPSLKRDVLAAAQAEGPWSGWWGTASTMRPSWRAPMCLLPWGRGLGVPRECRRGHRLEPVRGSPAGAASGATGHAGGASEPGLGGAVQRGLHSLAMLGYLPPGGGPGHGTEFTVGGGQLLAHRPLSVPRPFLFACKRDGHSLPADTALRRAGAGDHRRVRLGLASRPVRRLEREGERILQQDATVVDDDQAPRQGVQKQSNPSQ
jgi:Cu2+-exporting ATPase